LQRESCRHDVAKPLDISNRRLAEVPRVIAIEVPGVFVVTNSETVAADSSDGAVIAFVNMIILVWRSIPMAHDFKVGDHVEWNSEAGRVRGTIKKKITSRILFKGYTVHASKEEPQYEIKSDKTDHVAMHKGSALKKLRKSKRPSA